MSIRVMSIVWDRYPDGGAKLLTMLALADWGNDDGERIYPSMETLAGKIRMSRRQVIRIIQGLVETDFLEHLNPENLGGRLSSNRYRIKLETLTICHSRRNGDKLSVNGDKLSLNGDKLSVNGDTAMSHNPLEPLEPLYTSNRARDPAPGSTPSRRYGWPKKEPLNVTLKRHIETMESMPEIDELTRNEIERAKKELAELSPPDQGELLPDTESAGHG